LTWLLNNIEIVGFTASILGTVSLIPQVLKTWRSRSVSDISLVMYLIIGIDSLLWLIYGLVLALKPLIVQSSIIFFCACIMMIMKLLWK